MADYEVKMFTPDYVQSSTVDTYKELFGSNEEREQVEPFGSAFFNSGMDSDFTVPNDASTGDLVLMELGKQVFRIKGDNWFSAIVEVQSPDGKTFSFPLQQLITGSMEQSFREMLSSPVLSQETREMLSSPVPSQKTQVLKRFKNNRSDENSREQELKQHMKDYSWALFKEGLPDCMKLNHTGSLPYDERFSWTKATQFYYVASTCIFWSFLYGLIWRHKPWKSMDEIRRVFNHKPTEVSTYIHEHWMDDELFGYQFLNGINPMMIQRCSKLPSKFPVTDEMISLRGQSSLADEMKNGNIFLCDYNILDDVETNVINKKKQYLMAPLVLLQKTPDDKLMPIAIQLKQKPAEDNPIFFPADSEYDWLLAKIFVRSADANVHQLNSHLLRTHLLCEVFAVSLSRNVPMVHPLYKLLVAHTRYNLNIDLLARQKLISDDGIFTQFTASGGKGMVTILKKSLSSLTYRSLCIHDDISDRGLEDVPNFYYRDDGLKLWDIIQKFVSGIISYYYKNDDEVKEDTEVQKWIGDILEHGFLSKESTDSSGIPQSFSTVAELIKFVTMVIFTASVQHAAVNSGQYDFGAWMPNNPFTLQLPPPTKKGEATEAMMLATFPDVSVTVHAMDTLYLLSHQSTDFVRLGQYPKGRFTEKTPLKLIKDFQKDLDSLSKSIEDRNSKHKMQHKLHYPYLNPKLIENSVTI